MIWRKLKIENGKHLSPVGIVELLVEVSNNMISNFFFGNDFVKITQHTDTIFTKLFMKTGSNKFCSQVELCKILQRTFALLQFWKLDHLLFLEKTWLIFRAFKSAEVQNFAREFSYGLDFSLLLWTISERVCNKLHCSLNKGIY